MPKMFAHCVAAHGPLVALRQKQLGIWHSFTWSEFGALARLFDGFKSEGVAVILINMPDFSPGLTPEEKALSLKYSGLLEAPEAALDIVERTVPAGLPRRGRLHG